MPIAGLYGPEDFANTAHGSPTPEQPARAPTDRRNALPMPPLDWTPDVERATAHLYARVKHVISPVEWPLMAPLRKGDQRAEARARRGHTRP